MEMFSILGVVDQETRTAAGGGETGYLDMWKPTLGAGSSMLEKAHYPTLMRQAWAAPAVDYKAPSLGDMWFFCILVVIIVILGLAGAMFLYFRCGCSGGGGAKREAERELCPGMIL